MTDMIRESLVNYHNQLFGDAIESMFVTGASHELSELNRCQHQGWCPVKDSHNSHTGYFLEFDVKDFDLSEIYVDVFANVLCISAKPIQNLGSDCCGSEFGMYQLVNLPASVGNHAVTAYLKGKTLKIWIPRDEPLSQGEIYETQQNR